MQVGARLHWTWDFLSMRRNLFIMLEGACFGQSRWLFEHTTFYNVCDDVREDVSSSLKTRAKIRCLFLATSLPKMRSSAICKHDALVSWAATGVLGRLEGIAQSSLWMAQFCETSATRTAPLELSSLRLFHWLPSKSALANKGFKTYFVLREQRNVKCLVWL